MANTKKTAAKEVKAEVKTEAVEVKAAKAEPKAKAAGAKVVFDLSKMEKKQQLHEAFHAEKAFPDYALQVAMDTDFSEE